MASAGYRLFCVPRYCSSCLLSISDNLVKWFHMYLETSILLHGDDLIRDLWSSRSSQFSFLIVGGAGASQWPQGVCPAYAYTTRISRGRICMVVVEDIQISHRMGYSSAYQDLEDETKAPWFESAMMVALDMSDLPDHMH